MVYDEEMSDTDSVHSWAIVGDQPESDHTEDHSQPSSGEFIKVEEQEHSDSSSAGSSDFVKVEDSHTVAYHHKHADGQSGAEDEENNVAEVEDTCEGMRETEPAEPSSSTSQQHTPQHSEMIEDGALCEAEVTPASVDSVHVPAADIKLSKLRLDSSDSDHSDFVRLDPAMADEDESAPAVMRLSQSSSTSMASSVSSGFRFVPHPMMNPVELQQLRSQRRFYRDDDVYEDEDNESVPSDVDDRCESDISGVADESDLSAATYGLPGDLPITAGTRSYRHRPNTSLNAVLTTIALVTTAAALGIATGHYFGIQREQGIRRQQESKMRELQDDFLMCLKQRDEYKTEIQADDFPDRKLNAVTAVWKQKYQDLIVEKVDLEQSITDLQIKLEQTNEAFVMQQSELSHLKVAHSTSLVQTEEYMQREEAQKDDIANLNQQVKIKDQELQTKDQELQTKDQELVAAHQKLSELQSKDFEGSVPMEVESVKRALEEKEQELAVKEQEIEELKTRAVAMESVPKQESDRDMEQKEDSALQTDEPTELSVLRTELASMQKKYEEVTTALATRNAELMSVPASELTVYDVTDLKSEINLLRNENHDLKAEVSRLRYQPPSGSQGDAKVEDILMDEQPEDVVIVIGNDGSAQQATHIESENASSTPDLVLVPATGSSTEDDVTVEIVDDSNETFQASPDDGIEEKIDLKTLQDHVSKLSRDLAGKKARAELWRELYMQERASNKAGDKNASFITCVSLLLTSVNITDELSPYQETSVMGNISSQMKQQWTYLHNMVQDSAFTDKVRGLWDKFTRYSADSGKEGLSKKARKMFSKLESTLVNKWEELKKTPVPETVKKVVENEKLSKLVSKTKESVSQLTEKIHSTWNKVKNLSSDLLNTDKATHITHTVTDVKDKVYKVKDKVVDKVESGWKIVKDKMVDSGWVRRSHDKSHDKSHDWKREHPQDHRGNTGGYREEQIVTDSNMPAADEFESKPHHKQKRSSTLEEKYDEFWKKNNFNPDDYIYEDFFEGNQREWKKQQKRFKKIHGRINRLNEDMLYTMDDDDIEDIYDDLDDFEDDLDNDVAPAKLTAWLTCQIRWWKSRFQRKHRSQDYIRGCGAQLMHWQLRALCNPCGKRQTGAECTGDALACQYLRQTVIHLPPTSPPIQAAGKGSKDSCQNNKTRYSKALVLDIVLDGEKSRQQEKVAPQNESTWSADSSSKDPTSWYFNPRAVSPEASDAMAESEIWLAPGREGSKWSWERAQERENQRDHHDGREPVWAFKRAKNREFEREKPWWYKRVDGRRNEKPMTGKPGKKYKKGKNWK